MNDLSALRLFLAVTEESGFARGAQRLQMSAAQATRKIAALEAELGTRLFTRSTRRVSLTEAGAAFHVHALRIVSAVDETLEAVQASAARPHGRLRVGCRTALGRRLIVPYLHEFRARYPEVSVGLELTDSSMDILAGGLELGIDIGHLADSNLVARRLAETDSVLCASPDYIQRRGMPKHPRDLQWHDCITINAATGTRTWRFSRGRETATVRIKAALAVNDADGLMICACSGAGIVMVADWLPQEELRTGALVPILPDYQIEPRGTPITALYPSRVYLPQKARVFIDFFAEKCASLFGDERLAAHRPWTAGGSD